MGQSKLEIAITALNSATAELKDARKATEDLTSSTKQHTSAVNESNTANDKLKGGINDVVQGLTGFNIAEISVAGAILAGVEVMKASVDTTVSLGEATETTMLLTGGSAEQASKLNAISKDLGISTEVLQKAMEAAVRKGYEPSIAGLEKMGAEYKAIQDPQKQAKFLMDEFGKSGVNMKEVMEASASQLEQMGNRAANVGLVMDEKAVAAAKRYTIATHELSDVWEGFKNRLGQEIIPALGDLAEAELHEMDVQTAMTDVAQKYGFLETTVNQPAYVRSNKALRDLAEAELLNKQAMDAAKEASIYYKDAGIDPTIEALGGMTVATSSQTKAQDLAKQQLDLVTISFGKLTEQMVFNKASQGLTADASADLALKMGLLNQSTYDAMKKVETLNQQFQSGQLPLQQYEKDILAIKSAEDLLHDVHVTITATMVSQHQGTVPNNIPSTPSNKPKGPGRAIGGFAGGRTRVGENGPEELDLPPGTYVQNNYDLRTSYSLQAHYPTYQDPHAAKNDLIAMTMLKNQGASRWAA